MKEIKYLGMVCFGICIPFCTFLITMPQYRIIGIIGNILSISGIVVFLLIDSYWNKKDRDLD